MKKYDLYSRRDPAKNFSPLPNEVFYLGLSYGAIAVYGYLMHIEDTATCPARASTRPTPTAKSAFPAWWVRWSSRKPSPCPVM